MSPRTTGIVFLAAAALFAFIWFWEIGGEEGRKAAEEAEKQLFAGLEAGEVESIELTTSDGVAARLVRRKGPEAVDATETPEAPETPETPETGWELREPLVFPGDPFAIDGLASALADLKSEAVYQKPQAPEVYGLGEGALAVAFEAGGESHRLRIGGQTPIGSNVYAAVGGDERVYAVSSFAANALRKSLLDLRDKRVANFETDAVDRVEARWPDGHVVLRRGAEGWSLLEPIEGPADAATVDALLTDLSFLRASGFEDDPPPDPEAGLDAPEFSVELTGGEGEDALRASLAVGRAVDESGSRLVRSAGDSLYRIPAERLADFPRELVAYRYKQLASFQATEASRLEIAFERQESSAEGDAPVEIAATRGETGWESEPERFKPGLLAGLVSELSRLRGTDILREQVSPEELAELGLSPPSARIAVYGEGEAPLAQIRIGARRGDEGYAAMVEGGAQVYLLDPGVAEFVPVDLAAFRERFRSQEEPEDEGTAAEEAAVGEPGTDEAAAEEAAVDEPGTDEAAAEALGDPE